MCGMMACILTAVVGDIVRGSACLGVFDRSMAESDVVDMLADIVVVRWRFANRYVRKYRYDVLTQTS